MFLEAVDAVQPRHLEGCAVTREYESKHHRVVAFESHAETSQAIREVRQLPGAHLRKSARADLPQVRRMGYCGIEGTAP